MVQGRIDTSDIHERLARLETQVEIIQKDQTEENDRLKNIETSQQTILNELSKYKGMIGGIILVGSCLVVFLKSLPIVSFIIEYFSKTK